MDKRALFLKIIFMVTCSTLAYARDAKKSHVRTEGQYDIECDCFVQNGSTERNLKDISEALNATGFEAIHNKLHVHEYLNSVLDEQNGSTQVVKEKRIEVISSKEPEIVDDAVCDPDQDMFKEHSAVCVGGESRKKTKVFSTKVTDEFTVEGNVRRIQPGLPNMSNTNGGFSPNISNTEAELFFKLQF